MSKRKPYIPLYTDLTCRNVMVAGEGEDGARMVRYLSAYTDHLYYLTPRSCDLPDKLPQGVTVFRKEYERNDLYGMDYVVCVTEDEEVCEDIYVTCRTLGIRVYIRSNPKRCDFFLRTDTED